MKMGNFETDALAVFDSSNDGDDDRGGGGATTVAALLPEAP